MRLSASTDRRWGVGHNPQGETPTRAIMTGT
jgi:hypothetical protein